jgi:hypothetical protein
LENRIQILIDAINTKHKYGDDGYDPKQYNIKEKNWNRQEKPPLTYASNTLSGIPCTPSPRLKIGHP